MLFGKDGMDKLKNSRVALFGVGGVGGYAAEALVRSGVGAIDLIDGDTVSLTNINRQIIALHGTIGKYKAEVMKERILDINPNASVKAYNTFFLKETEDDFDFSGYSYIIDAVDNVSAKLALVLKAKKANVPIISAMGAGNKFDPMRFKVSDINKTSMCPLAKIMRSELKKLGIEKLKVVYSDEEPIKPLISEDVAEELKSSGKRQIPGSCAFVPSVMGLMIAREVIFDLTGMNNVKN